MKQRPKDAHDRFPKTSYEQRRCKAPKTPSSNRELSIVQTRNWALHALNLGRVSDTNEESRNRSLESRCALITAAALAVLLMAACTGAGNDPTTRRERKPADATRSTTAAGPHVVVPTFNREGLLAGSATPTFPEGTPGTMNVIYVGKVHRSPTGDGQLPIVIRNNTTASVAHVDVTATARDAAGRLVATGQSQATNPAQLVPGEAALSSIYFQNAKDIPKDATHDFSFETIPADTSPYNTASVKVTEVNRSGDTIVGTAENTTGAQVTGPYAVKVYCFDKKGDIVSTEGSFADQDRDVAPDGEVTFTVPLYGDPCPTFLVGVTGFFA